MRTRQFVIALSLVALVGACGSDDDGASDAATTDPAAAESSGSTESSDAAGAGDAAAASGSVITISDFTFSPAELTAPAGSIDITNDDDTAHTVTADDGAFDVEVGGGGAGSITVDAPGTYTYHCNFHSSMNGTLIVT